LIEVYTNPVLKIQVLIEEKKPKNSNRISVILYFIIFNLEIAEIIYMTPLAKALQASALFDSSF